MDNTVFFLILLATIMHAIWNGMVKKHSDKAVALAGIILGHIPFSIVAIILLPAPSIESIPYIFASIVVHIGYQWFLLKSYEIGDLTKVYPIARGTGPLFVTIISILLLGVVLNKFILISIFLICFGIFFLGISDYKNSSLNVIKFSIITGLFI